MFGINDLEVLRRRIAEAGMICIGAGVLWTGGCAGAARDGLAAAGTKPGAGEAQIASAEDAGHASLSDRRTAGTKRRADRPSADRQVAARNRRVRGRQPAADPFLDQRGAVARRTARPPRPATAPAARPPAMEGEATVAPAQIAARPSVAEPKATATANTRSTPAPATVAKAAQKPRSTERTITQASAKSSQEVRRARPPVTAPAETAAPVITPAAPTSAAADTSAVLGYERQRADRLMERAHLMLNQNFDEEALRLATVAEQLEKSKQAIYRPGEERPSELVARLQRVSVETDGGSADSKATLAAPAAQRNRSQPAQPIPVGVRRGRVELTEINAGWHAAPGSAEDDAESSDPTTTGAAPSEQDQVALLDSSRGTNASPSPLASSGTAESAEAPAPQEIGSNASSDSTEMAPGPAGEDLAENSGSSEPETGASSSPVNMTTAIGLIAGLAGLLGIAFWRRQERKHYAATSR